MVITLNKSIPLAKRKKRDPRKQVKLIARKTIPLWISGRFSLAMNNTLRHIEKNELEIVNESQFRYYFFHFLFEELRDTNLVIHPEFEINEYRNYSNYGPYSKRCDFLIKNRKSGTEVAIEFGFINGLGSGNIENKIKTDLNKIRNFKRRMFVLVDSSGIDHGYLEQKFGEYGLWYYSLY